VSALHPGQPLRCVASRAPCVVEALLDEGGQGEVWRVRVGAEPYALKWYNDIVLRVDRTLRTRLQVAIDRGAPAPEFLWPFELVTLADGSRLGYLMRLRNPAFLKIHTVLAEKAKPSFRVLAAVGWRLTESLLALHTKGLVYQDLNPGNVFFDPATGDIEICDNDNVDIAGAPSVMAGMWEFAAPEVVLRQAGPSRETDLHSLAVMLFRLLHIGHPLVGRRELDHSNLADPSVLRRVFGSHARFVFDPADDSNRPLPERHGPVLAHWEIYPQALRELFVRAFTEGLYDPRHGRVQETEWRHAMRLLHDAVQTCPHCGVQNFYDQQRLARRQAHHACWNCHVGLTSAPPRVGLRRAGARPGEAPQRVVVLEPGVRLDAPRSRSAPADSAADARVPAEVPAQAPLTLLNVGARQWRWRAPDTGEPGGVIEPGETLPLAFGMSIDFGALVGEVKLSGERREREARQLQQIVGG
jgi:eukaryotic-like serine/threonine-protein kinase